MLWKKNKKFIFTFTTGRSGTKYLYALLRDCCPEVSVYHERLNLSTVMHEMNNGTTRHEATKYVRHQKLPQLEQDVGDKDIYVETNHLVCKCFLEELIHELANVKIIYLYRNMIDVATSLYSHDTIPKVRTGRRHFASRYYILWTDKNVRFDITNADTEFTDLDLCFWYCFEMMARAEEFIAKYPDITHSVTLDDINTFGGAKRLFQELGVGKVDYNKLQKLVGKKVHIGSKRKPNVPSLSEIDLSFRKIAKLYYGE